MPASNNLTMPAFAGKVNEERKRKIHARGLSIFY